MNRNFTGLLLLLTLSASVHAVAPQRFDIDDFFTDAKLIATGTILDGKAKIEKGSDQACGVSFKVRIDKAVMGARKGDIVKVHHITDYRYGSLEVGSKYFIYAEDRSTHKLINLGDAIDPNLNDDRAKECHGKSIRLYIYREFTHKVFADEGYSWIGDFNIDAWVGIQQINETSSLPMVYRGVRDGKYGYFLESREFGFQHHKMIYGGALALDPLINLFRAKYKKSLNKQRQQD